MENQDRAIKFLIDLNYDKLEFIAELYSTLASY